MGVESTELKRILLDLLDRDEEFRYAVAGRLELSEILRRLDRLEENQVKLWEEVRRLREGQQRLWEGQNKLWEEVKLLREGQNRLWEEVKSIRNEMKGMRAEVKSFGRAVGRTLEDYTMAFVEIILEEKGYAKDKIRLRREKIIHEKEEEEINIFNEDPLVVGEVTTCVESEEKAVDEISKVVKRINLAQKKLGRKVEYAFLAIGNVSKEALEKLEEEAKRNGIDLILGRIIEAQELF